MALICNNNKGAVVSHLKYINDEYNRVGATSGQMSTDYSVQFKSDFFELHNPFVMDSQFEKMKMRTAENGSPQSTTSTNTDFVLVKKKKRKRKYVEMSEKEEVATGYHSQISSILQIALKQLLHLAQSYCHLLPRNEPPKDNNMCARRAAKLSDNRQDFVELSQKMSTSDLSADDPLDIHHIKDDSRIFNRLIHHDDEHVCIKKMLGASYVFPPNCAFLMSDISFLQPLTEEGTKYDLIVIDPPWYNKSVRRKSKYQMLYDEDLLQIPIKTLANPNCLVVVWATNNQQQHKFIRQEFFPQQHIKYLARWYWLKVTKHGQTVTVLESEHKKPYETIFLGYVQSDQQTSDDHVTSQVTKSDYTTAAAANEGQMLCCEDHLKPSRLKTIPDDYVVISVPSSLHSHKPPLGEILKPFLPAEAKCLEMFARCLLPGWVSWGNEVLKLQQSTFYEISQT